MSKTIPIKNKSIDEIILKSKSLLFVTLSFIRGLLNRVACIISHPPSKNNVIDDIIDNTTAIITINLVLHSAFSKICSNIFILFFSFKYIKSQCNQQFLFTFNNLYFKIYNQGRFISFIDNKYKQLLKENYLIVADWSYCHYIGSFLFKNSKITIENECRFF